MSNPHRRAGCRSREAAVQKSGLCFAPQNMSKFWDVMTRPVAANGLGFSPAFALAEVGKIETVLTLLPDTPVVYAAAA